MDVSIEFMRISSWHDSTLLAVLFYCFQNSSNLDVRGPDASVGTSTSSEGMAYKERSSIGMFETQCAALPASSDSAPVQFDNPMTEQIGLGVQQIFAGDIPLRVDCVQMKPAGQGSLEVGKQHVLILSSHSVEVPWIFWINPAQFIHSVNQLPSSRETRGTVEALYLCGLAFFIH
jgi:hypothetical protein